MVYEQELMKRWYNISTAHNNLKKLSPSNNDDIIESENRRLDIQRIHSELKEIYRELMEYLQDG